MDLRKIVSALAALPKEQVEKIARAADASRSAEQALATLAPVPVRRKRGPNKPKVEAPAPVAAPAPARRGRPAAKPLASAIDRLRAVKAGGIKTRKQVLPDDED